MASPNSPSGGDLKRVRVRFAIFISTAIVTSAFADVTLKHGLGLLRFPPLDSIAGGLICLKMILSSKWMVAGITLIVADFFAFFKALQLGSLTVAIPLRSTTYALTPLLAYLALGEQIPSGRWLALIVVLVGVCLVGRSAVESL